MRAGVARQEGFRELARAEFSAVGDLGLRVGINTGEVLVSGDNTDVGGDPVNSAAQLQQEAPDGDGVLRRRLCHRRGALHRRHRPLAAIGQSGFTGDHLSHNIDHGQELWYAMTMDTMPISKFKATYLSALERVRRTGRPLRVTRFGKPVADVVPPAPEKPPQDWLGSLRGTLEIRGGIVAPSEALAKWEALD